MGASRLITALAGLAALAVLAGCGGGASEGGRSADFTIVSGSENEALEPLVQDFCKKKRKTCVMDFKGSLDIGLSLRPGEDPAADAVWPASSVWIDLYDAERRVRDAKSIYQTPVILGVRISKAKELGWIGKQVSMADILRAVEEKRLSFLMTSATQSNSGASAYLAMLAAALGQPDEAIAEKQLNNAKARDAVRRMLAGVARSAGSSGWLGELYVETAKEGRPFDAMWNYEAVLKETNDSLRAASKERLYAIYPAEGSSVADAPLGFVERGRGEAARKFFDELQAYLLSQSAQKEIAKQGRRIPLGRANAAPPEQDWNFDPNRLVTAIPAPAPEAIRAALNLYQETLRRPSLTVLCLDVSGSMSGEGETQLKEGLNFLFTPDRAREALVQWSPRDRIIVIPFNQRAKQAYRATGDAAAQARLNAQLQQLDVGGGTNMYACAEKALVEMRADLAQNQYLPAIVLMTDGRSDDQFDRFMRAWRNDGHAVPVFGVTFGDAEKDQLKAISTATRARVFDGGDDLAKAFRATRGYN